MLTSRSAAAALTLCAFLSCSPVLAGTTSGTPFTVQVTITAGCAINSGPTGTIDFGSVAGTAATPADIASSVSVTCTNTTPYVVRFTSSNAVTGNTNRIMANGAQSIGYQIIKTAGSVLIGNTNATGISATGNGAAQVTPINFHINTWTPVTPAVYTDSVTLQVDF